MRASLILGKVGKAIRTSAGVVDKKADKSRMRG